jgi:hypothetical protein
VSGLAPAARKALELRDHYRHVFRSEHGKAVLSDLIKRFIVNSPVSENPDLTKINLGMEEAIRWLCKKALVNDRDFEQAIRDSFNQNQEHE